MESFVLDTNIFFNMEAGLSLGKKTEELVVNLTEKIKKLSQEKKAVFYITPKIVDEFLSFFEDKEQSFIKDFLSVVVVESPKINEMVFPASIFQKIIEEIRLRSYRGLNIAKEELGAAAKFFLKEKPKTIKEFQIKIGDFIKKLRERYRQATRKGFLDSSADFELIALAKEKDGFLVTTDEGVISWGRVFGVKEMPSLIFLKHLEFLLQHHPEPNQKEK